MIRMTSAFGHKRKPTGTAKSSVGKRTIRRSARELAHTDRVREATAEMLGRWGGVLDRLGNA
jgi:hypothetical protein